METYTVTFVENNFSDEELEILEGYLTESDFGAKILTAYDLDDFDEFKTSAEQEMLMHHIGADVYAALMTRGLDMVIFTRI